MRYRHIHVHGKLVTNNRKFQPEVAAQSKTNFTWSNKLVLLGEDIAAKKYYLLWLLNRMQLLNLVKTMMYD